MDVIHLPSKDRKFILTVGDNPEKKRGRPKLFRELTKALKKAGAPAPEEAPANRADQRPEAAAPVTARIESLIWKNVEDELLGTFPFCMKNDGRIPHLSPFIRLVRRLHALFYVTS